MLSVPCADSLTIAVIAASRGFECDISDSIYADQAEPALGGPIGQETCSKVGLADDSFNQLAQIGFVLHISSDLRK
jgi:hypothetical protein